MYRIQELVRLARMGIQAHQRAQLLQMSPNTERKYRQALQKAEIWDGLVQELPELEELKAAVQEQVEFSGSMRGSSVEQWGEKMKEHWGKGLSPTAIYDRLRMEEKDFRGSLSAVKRYCRHFSKEEGVRATEVAIPVETAAGEVAQVDFGYVGKYYDEKEQKQRKAWVFSMVLSYSGHRYDEIVFDQSSATWCRMHENAFRFFGGVPEKIVPDNLKSAVVKSHFHADSSEMELNRNYRELAKHYGFMIEPAGSYQPQQKGKVERAIQYVKNNGLKGREGESQRLVNEQLKCWDLKVAGLRRHGSTGKQPLVFFEQEEQKELLPLPTTSYEVVEWKKVTVHRDSHVLFRGKLYSVPWKLLGQQVWVKATACSVLVYADDERVATHSRKFSGKRSTQENHLPEGRRELRHRDFSYCLSQAEKLGPETHQLIQRVLEQDSVCSHLGAAQSILLFLEKLSEERREGVSCRCNYFGILRYQEVKNVARHKLDIEPLELPPSQALCISKQYRFVRRTKGNLHQEAHHGNH